MFINAEHPSYSVRTHVRRDGSAVAIAAGSHFKPGHPDDERKHFAEIEAWLRTHFQAGAPTYRWTNEDYASVDSAPFVGWSGGKGEGFLVATGFNAWGITNGAAAATVIAALAQGKEHAWLEIFDASRVKPLAGAARFVKETAQVVSHLAGGYLSRKLDSLDALALGEAGIVKIDGKNIAAFRDESGTVHAVLAACTHLGCVLGWNEADRTWDCPCHGSRFALDGEVIHGPAVSALERHTVDAKARAT